MGEGRLEGRGGGGRSPACGTRFVVFFFPPLYFVFAFVLLFFSGLFCSVVRLCFVALYFVFRNLEDHLRFAFVGAYIFAFCVMTSFRRACYGVYEWMTPPEGWGWAGVLFGWAGVLFWAFLSVSCGFRFFFFFFKFVSFSSLGSFARTPSRRRKQLFFMPRGSFFVVGELRLWYIEFLLFPFVLDALL